MRHILITVMLVIVVIAIYSATVGGETGMEHNVRSTGGSLNGTIQSINP
ncbi:hypothetical protein ACFFNY_18830 [Paenibacillus hodogayensis]|uniref:Uncharacterized protein n=1 Tax=Paenibacillus hodogayensis TaxID=279208 RepID=A0ABV5VZF4_9BACL